MRSYGCTDNLDFLIACSIVHCLLSALFLLLLLLLLLFIAVASMIRYRHRGPESIEVCMGRRRREGRKEAARK